MVGVLSFLFACLFWLYCLGTIDFISPEPAKVLFRNGLLFPFNFLPPSACGFSLSLRVVFLSFLARKIPIARFSDFYLRGRENGSLGHFATEFQKAISSSGLRFGVRGLRSSFG